MSENRWASTHPGQPIPREAIPQSSFVAFRKLVVEEAAAGHRVAALFGAGAGSTGFVDLYAVLADRLRGQLRVVKTALDADRFASLTPDCPQVHLFEREIAEQYGVCPAGHPWLKPVRFHASYRPGHDALGRSPG